MISSSSRRQFLIASTAAALTLKAGTGAKVTNVGAPGNGVQPQAVVDSKGIIHLIYLYGDPAASNIAYVRKGPQDQVFSAPRVVNSPGSAIAMGTVRGAQIALGRADRIHIAWNGSSQTKPQGPHHSEPMFYTRLNERGDAFEPERSVMTMASGLDGGGSVAADSAGNVYVTWHAQGQKDGQPIQGEGYRRVWMARSSDDGKTFEAERAVSPELGACGCCGMGALADGAGNLYLLYRTARETVHRDICLLVSRDRGVTFQSTVLDRWNIGACPMSTVSLTLPGGTLPSGGVRLAWETANQVYFATVDSRTGVAGTPIAPPGESKNRKHPTIAVNKAGETLLAWTEGTGWKRGGALAWQIFDSAGRPTPERGGSAALPAWDFAASIAMGNQFLLIS